METILYATGNPGKVDSLQAVLGEFPGLQIDHVDLELSELQLNSVDEIAKDKVRQVYEKTKKPILVQDTGFLIPSLKGFPGPYTKYALETMGVEGILKAVGDKRRSGVFHECLAYSDGTQIKVFQTFITGELTEELRGPIKKHATSNLWNVFIPTGQYKTIAEMTDDERGAWRHSREIDHYGLQFARWLEKQNAIA